MAKTNRQMRKLLGLVTYLVGVMVSSVACRQELLKQLSPAPLVCQVPPIQENIIGSWKYESALDATRIVSSGSVTFEQGGTIVDLDSLFTNRLYGQVVRGKTYAIGDSPTSLYPGKVLNVYLVYGSNKQTTYYTIKQNQCNYIYLTLIGSANDERYFVLTR